MSGNTTWFGVQYPSSSDYVKDGATAIQTVADGFDSAVAIPTYNAQTGSTYTFVLADTSKTVTASNAAASTYTIPPQSSVVWVANTTLSVTNLGAGVVTFVGGVGVTVTNATNTLSQFQSAQLIRTGSNAWTVVPTSGISLSPGNVLINATTFTAQASVSLNNVFSASYENYLVSYNITASSATVIRNRFRVSGTDNSANSYENGSMYVGAFNNVAFTTVNSALATYFTFGTSSATVGYGGTINYMAPFATEYTKGISNSVGGDILNAGCIFNGTTSFDGFSIFPDSGTITGSIRVYGLRNS